ncbi:MAG: hypothetical protein LKK08_07485 [Bacteroidales bacterium]|jgi:hypothetical protein|nr:hypothetical protein [Bacteroidales bacterium]MCI2146063.1 hypothetical protein [Bacteroidales bacterium]
MLSKEEVIGIVTYCREEGKTYKDRCAEVGIPLWKFYDSKRRYRKEEAESGDRGEFVQLRGGGPFQSGNLRGIEGKTIKGPGKNDGTQSGFMSVEMQTQGGTILRIYGEMTPALLREIVQTL